MINKNLNSPDCEPFLIGLVTKPHDGLFNFSNMEIRKCDFCGNDYIVKHSKQRFCKRQCKYDFEAMTTKKIYKPKKCAICGSLFIPKTIKNKYCSPACLYEAEKEKRSKKPKYKICLYCKKEFKPYTSLDKFCSGECRINNVKSKRSKNWSKEKCIGITEEKNPSYRNGFYCRSNTKTSIKERVFIRNRNEIKSSMIDNYGYLYCQFCGTTNSYRFETHHIIFRSEKPNHKNLHDKRNLIHVCINCHNELHKYKQKRIKLINERGLIELFGNDILMTHKENSQKNI